MTRRLIHVAALLAACLGLVACGEDDLRPQRPGASDEVVSRAYVASLQEMTLKLANDPDNPELRTAYEQLRDEAVSRHVLEARDYADEGDLGSAEAVLSQGLLVLPDDEILKSEFARIQELKRARALYREAAGAARQGYYDKAVNKLESALKADPSMEPAIKLLTEIEGRQNDTSIKPIRLSSGAPVTLSFRDVPFKEAMLSLGQAYGVNMIFDADLEDRPISLYVEDVRFSQAFKLLLRSNKAFYRRMGSNSVIIASDTPEGRARYEDYIVRTFYIENAEPQAIGELISRSLGMDTVSVNEEAGSVTVRDARERVAMAERLVQSHDRTPAEVVMEVEILEVNRTKSEQLGLDFGSQIGVNPPALEVREFDSLEEVGEAWGVSALSLPAVTLRYFKQDVDAETLANPSLRTVNARQSMIHIGDRVPLRSSTIQDATGQTRTTFEYRDVGIKLTVTPDIRLDRSVAIDTVLEVSSLGQNLGTANEPAFAIGTRNVETRMVLEDGETAIIGGLIRDEERRTVQAVPGLGRIPAVGKLFRAKDGEGRRTDIVLTLSPRIIRGKDIAGLPETQFFSGNGERVTSDPNVDFVSSHAGNQPTIRLDLAGSTTFTPALSTAALDRASSAAPALPTPAALPASRDGAAELSFGAASYETGVDETVEIPIFVTGIDQEVGAEIEVKLRGDLLEILSVDTTGDVAATVDATAGSARIPFAGSGPGKAQIATLTVRSRKAGLSYLILSGGAAATLPEGTRLAQSRIIIR